MRVKIRTDHLPLILSLSKDHGELVEPSATVLRQAQDERVVNFHNFEKALHPTLYTVSLAPAIIVTAEQANAKAVDEASVRQ